MEIPRAATRQRYKRRRPNPVDPDMTITSATIRFPTEVVRDIEALVALDVFPNRSAAIEQAVLDMLRRKASLLPAGREALAAAMDAQRTMDDLARAAARRTTV